MSNGITKTIVGADTNQHGDDILAEHHAGIAMKFLADEMGKTMYSVTEAHPDVFDTFIPERQIITAVISDFKKCYASLFNKNITTVGEAINTGDCGLAAFCIGYVLQKLFYIPISLHDNDDHAWLAFGGVEYDCKHDKGIIDSIDTEWQFTVTEHTREALVVDFEDLMINYITRADKLAHRMICGFLGRYDLSLEDSKLNMLLLATDTELFAKNCEPDIDIKGMASSRDIVLHLQDGDVLFECVELMYRFKEYEFQRGGNATVRVKHNGKEYRFTQRDKILSRDLVFNTKEEYIAFRNNAQTGPESGRLFKLPGIKIIVKDQL